MLTEQRPGRVAARPPRFAPPAGAGTAEALRFAVRTMLVWVPAGLSTPAIVHRLGPADTETDPWASTFRRHRLKKSRRRDRPGWSLRLVFDTPEPGPLLLGQLSHFGFGIFIPESRDR